MTPLTPLCPLPPPPPPLTFLCPSAHLLLSDTRAILLQFGAPGTALFPRCLPTCAFPESLVKTLLKSGVVAGTELARACCLLQGLEIATSARRAPRTHEPVLHSGGASGK